MTLGDRGLFLLGGYDLEMVAIRELLLSNSYTEVTLSNFHNSKGGFADRKLSWGASVHDYAEYMKYPGPIYGIELSEPPDWKRPTHYHRIDHHNELPPRPSSLEQAATVIGADISSRYHQLVIANDVGYIKAMEAIGATESEIEKIRRADRAAQGVTPEDEELAQRSIDEQLQRVSDVVKIRALTEKFSPITDRMYGKADKLLIVADHKLNYYGPGVSKLSKVYAALIAEGKAYSGGGEDGFFGIADKAFRKAELDNELVPEIIKLVGNG